MRVQTIVYVMDMDRCVDWYRIVLGAEPTEQGTHWSSFLIGSAVVALHLIDEPLESGKLELSLVVSEPLEEVIARLTGAGIMVERGIIDESFGRSIRLRDPEGLPIQVNEHDPEPSTD